MVKTLEKIDSLIKYQKICNNEKITVSTQTKRFLVSNQISVDIELEENSHLDYVIFNDVDAKNSILNIKMAKNSTLKLYNIILSSKSTELKENITLQESGANCEIINVLLAYNQAMINSDINIYHNVGYTTSIFENYGIAKDEGMLLLNNNATIKKGASKAVASQKAKGLTLSEKAKIKAMPNLYIDEYDVIANHSAAIGSISKDDLFYLMSRGLSVNDATNLVVMGFIKPIIDKIDDESLKNKIAKTFIEKLTN